MDNLYISVYMDSTFNVFSILHKMFINAFPHCSSMSLMWHWLTVFHLSLLQDISNPKPGRVSQKIFIIKQNLQILQKWPLQKQNCILGPKTLIPKKIHKHTLASWMTPNTQIVPGTITKTDNITNLLSYL